MIDLWQEIYGTIKRNKLRTFLTGFAVAWGIFMLIVLLGAGNGLIHAFEENSGERALNSIRVYGGWTTKPYDGLKEGRSIDLDNRDLEDTEAFFTDRVEGAGATLYQAAKEHRPAQEVGRRAVRQDAHRAPGAVCQRRRSGLPGGGHL